MRENANRFDNPPPYPELLLLTMSSDTDAETRFNYVLGGLSIIATLFSASVVFNKFLPKSRMELFDALLQDTNSIYNQLMELRANLVTTSQKERERRQAEDAAREGRNTATTDNDEDHAGDMQGAGNPFAVPPSPDGNSGFAPHHCSFCIYSIVQWLSTPFSRRGNATKIAEGTIHVDTPDPDVFTTSRTSTLVEDPPPIIKSSFWRLLSGSTDSQSATSVGIVEAISDSDNMPTSGVHGHADPEQNLTSILPIQFGSNGALRL
ncbi:hypothetical protein DXG03_002337 [Asterophora parasitica]|uniref:Uncharacterized protein n=1 Tax=Asterophora parasitica TaxID=117018 RepID=A0A9P7G4F7_9AGAR|nr:hypothetical protein DXG03_002337 [Asterophora parasitica]